ncbi:hypothetical protein [Streptomyces abikoensis]|uniref:Uncharacterized protein n=1 Tax=Streptomyces abikoensis TaxID=97398 RepID=A0ABW7T4L9_9ACTN
MNRERVEEAARQDFQQALDDKHTVSMVALEQIWDALHRWNPDPPDVGPPDEPTLVLPAWHPQRPELPRRCGRARHKRPRARPARWLIVLCSAPAAFVLGVLLAALN